MSENGQNTMARPSLLEILNWGHGLGNNLQIVLTDPIFEANKSEIREIRKRLGVLQSNLLGYWDWDKIEERYNCIYDDYATMLAESIKGNNTRRTHGDLLLLSRLRICTDKENRVFLLAGGVNKKYIAITMDSHRNLKYPTWLQKMIDREEPEETEENGEDRAIKNMVKVDVITESQAFGDFKPETEVLLEYLNGLIQQKAQEDSLSTRQQRIYQYEIQARKQRQLSQGENAQGLSKGKVTLLEDGTVTVYAQEDERGARGKNPRGKKRPIIDQSIVADLQERTEFLEELGPISPSPIPTKRIIVRDDERDTNQAVIDYKTYIYEKVDTYKTKREKLLVFFSEPDLGENATIVYTCKSDVLEGLDEQDRGKMIELIIQEYMGKSASAQQEDPLIIRLNHSRDIGEQDKFESKMRRFIDKVGFLIEDEVGGKVGPDLVVRKKKMLKALLEDKGDEELD